MIVKAVVEVVPKAVESGDVVVAAADCSVDKSLGICKACAILASANLTVVSASVGVGFGGVPDAVVGPDGCIGRIASSGSLETCRTVSNSQDVLSASSVVERNSSLSDIFCRRVVSRYICVCDMVCDLLSDGRSDRRSRLVDDIQRIDLLRASEDVIELLKDQVKVYVVGA